MKKKIFKRLFGFMRLVKPFAQIWTRAMTWQSSCTRNLRKPSFANAHSYGFTLAEVLITLSILGVVAAITVPSLINRNTEKQTVTKLKKEYSALTEAYEIAIAENGTPTSWGITGSNFNKALEFAKKLQPYLKVKNICETSDCDTIPNYSVKSLDGTSAGNFINTSNNIPIELSDGTIITMDFGNPTCNGDKYACGTIEIDLNGKQNPNQYGRDIFNFRTTKDRLVSLGTPEEARLNGDTTSVKTWIGALCNRNSNRADNGKACGGWVIYKGNMDYLRKDISWD